MRQAQFAASIGSVHILFFLNYARKGSKGIRHGQSIWQPYGSKREILYAVAWPDIFRSASNFF
jgi:hypothetical protein